MDREEGATTKSTSEVFETIARIHRKTDSLRKSLAPVIQAVPENVEKDVMNGTKLLNELKLIERDITNLLDSIQL